MNNQDIWHWLGPLAQAWKASDSLQEQEAVLLWPAVGLTNLARALYVDHGVLHLAVGSHVVASELNLVKTRVLTRLSSVAPESRVTDLRFHVQASTSGLTSIEVRPPEPNDVRRAQRELPPEIPPNLRRVIALLMEWARARDEAILAHGGWQCRECGLVLAREKGQCPGCRIDRLGTRH